MTLKIAGWMCAVALLFGPVIAIDGTTPHAFALGAEDGSNPFPPPTIPPALAAVDSASLTDGSNPFPPPTIPPTLGAVNSASLIDGSNPFPPPTIPPALAA